MRFLLISLCTKHKTYQKNNTGDQLLTIMIKDANIFHDLFLFLNPLIIFIKQSIMSELTTFWWEISWSLPWQQYLKDKFVFNITLNSRCTSLDINVPFTHIFIRLKYLLMVTMRYLHILLFINNGLSTDLDDQLIL